jgi:hypothetical protein
MGGSTPQMPSPQDSMRAEAMAQLAGSEFNLGSAPLQAYAQAINSLQFDPTFQRISSADSSNSALANAQASKQISSQVNPYGSAGQDTVAKATNMRLANMEGQPLYPGLTPGNTSQPFNYPSSSSLPNFQDIQNQSKAITTAMPGVTFGNNTVDLQYPQSSQSAPPLPSPINPLSYYQGMPSGS